MTRVTNDSLRGESRPRAGARVASRPGAPPDGRGRSRQGRQRGNPRHGRGAWPDRPSIPLATLALLILAASLALTAVVVRTGLGDLQVSVITAVGVFTFLILAKAARVPWAYVALVAVPYFPAVVAVLFLTATDDGPYTSWQALECLVAYHPAGFGIGFFTGMIVATWND